MRLKLPQEVELAGDITVMARAGDFLITRGREVLRVLPAHEFTQQYDPVVPGQLTLSAADCAALEATLGLGSAQSTVQLLAAVERVASISIGDVRLAFTPGQLAELAHRAEKRGRSVSAEMKAVVARIEDELFHKGG